MNGVFGGMYLGFLLVWVCFDGVWGFDFKFFVFEGGGDGGFERRDWGFEGGGIGVEIFGFEVRGWVFGFLDFEGKGSWEFKRLVFRNGDFWVLRVIGLFRDDRFVV